MGFVQALQIEESNASHTKTKLSLSSEVGFVFILIFWYPCVSVSN